MSTTSIAAHPFIRKVRRTLRDHNLLPEGAAVLVGVSGGPDSMALLHALMVLSQTLSFRVGVAHFNHRLRGEAAEADARFVAETAQVYGISCHIAAGDIRRESRDRGLSLEEAGRNARYRFFEAVCREQGFDRIAVGHHQDDNAELILMYLLRGSGPAGMGGMRPVRGRIIRPLLYATRSEIRDFLSYGNWPYRLDASNLDVSFPRNRIRHQLLPLLEQDYNPRISAGLNRLGAVLQSEEEWMERMLDPVYDQAVMDRGHGWIDLAIDCLTRVPEAARRRIARRAILQVKGNLRRIRFSHVEAVMGLIAGGRTAGSLDLPDRIRVSRRANRLTIAQLDTPLRRTPANAARNPVPAFAYTVSESQVRSGRPLYLRETGMILALRRLQVSECPALPETGHHGAVFDWDQLQFPLTVRNCRPGDRFTPLGMAGRQKMKKFFAGNHIPPAERGGITLLVSGETIIWVGGCRTSEQAKVTTATRTLLAAELTPAANRI